MIGVVTSDVAVSENFIDGLGYFLESGLSLYIFVADACELYDDVRNGFLWVDEIVSSFLSSVREYLDVGYLYDSVFDDV